MISPAPGAGLGKGARLMRQGEPCAAAWQGRLAEPSTPARQPHPRPHRTDGNRADAFGESAPTLFPSGKADAHFGDTVRSPPYPGDRFVVALLAKTCVTIGFASHPSPRHSCYHLAIPNADSSARQPATRRQKSRGDGEPDQEQQQERRLLGGQPHPPYSGAGSKARVVLPRRARKAANGPLNSTSPVRFFPSGNSSGTW